MVLVQLNLVVKVVVEMEKVLLVQLLVLELLTQVLEVVEVKVLLLLVQEVVV